MAITLNPYLGFHGNAKAAMEFYHTVLGGELTSSTFADFQERSAEGADMQWLTQIAKAQADFTRDVTQYSTDAARRFLK